MNTYTYLYTNTSVRFLRETAGQTKGIGEKSSYPFLF